MVFNAIMKLLVLIATCIERLFVVILISMSIRKWVWVPLDKPTELKEETIINNVVDEKFYTLYNKYIEVGNETKIGYELFEAWFVIQYSVYLLSVLKDTIHLIKPLYHEDDEKVVKVDKLDLQLFL